MGWFDSIIGGIGSAVDWALSNSGGIGDMISTVGKVAGIWSLENGDVGSSATRKDNLFDSYRAAEKVLKKKAQNAAEEETARASSDPAHVWARTFDETISGLWTNPAATETGDAPEEMYHDVAKFLAENGFAKTIEGRKGATIDVAQNIGRVIFANSPADPKLMDVHANANDLIQVTPFTIQNKDRSCEITGAHACYAVPLGKSATENAWHGALHVQQRANNDFMQQYRAQEYTLQSIGTAKDIEPPYWMITCQIDWTTVELAEKAGQSIKKNFNEKSDYKNFYEIDTDLINGQRQTTKIRVNSKKTPAQGRAALEKVISEFLTPVTLASSLNVQTPRITVTDSSLIT